jgi:hypothetical protein
MRIKTIARLLLIKMNKALIGFVTGEEDQALSTETVGCFCFAYLLPVIK